MIDSFEVKALRVQTDGGEELGKRKRVVAKRSESSVRLR
jgi:hypothetical protein